MGCGASAPPTLKGTSEEPPVVLVHLDESSQEDLLENEEEEEANPAKFLVLLLGAEGAFSPTDGYAIASALGGTYIQYNKLMRDAILGGSAEGAQIEKHLTSGGGAVPARLILKFIFPIISTMPTPHLLDGFPKTMQHLTLLENQLEPCAGAVHFDLSDAEVLENLTKRGVERSLAEKKIQQYYMTTMPMVRHLQSRGVVWKVSGPDIMAQAESALRRLIGMHSPRLSKRRSSGSIRGSSSRSPRRFTVSLEARPPEPPVPLTPLFGPAQPAREDAGIRPMPPPVGKGAPPPPTPPPMPTHKPAYKLATQAEQSAATLFQARIRATIARKQLRQEQEAAVKWQAITRGGLARQRVQRAKPEPIEKALVIRAHHVDDDVGGAADGRRAAPFEADLSALTKVAKNDLGLFEQPAHPKFKVGLVQVFVRGTSFGGDDKSSNGHRYDMVPLANGMIRAGMSCHAFHYRHEEHHKFLRACRTFDVILLRFRRGDIEADGGDVHKFEEAMRILQNDAGVIVWPSPDKWELPAPLLASFHEPGDGDGVTRRRATAPEDIYLGPALWQCSDALCSEKQPRACWVDVGEEEMTSAIMCGTRVASTMLELLSAARGRQADL